jgi:FixJ family two-component response regulator
MDSPKGNIYVAVVDDDASVCRALARLLREAGYQSVTYGSAEQLLGDNDRPRFGCLLLDVQLITKSGVELQEQLAASGETTPVIFITAHDDPKTREQAQRAGCAAYLRKTAPGDELLGIIRGVVDQNRTRSANAMRRPGV